MKSGRPKTVDKFFSQKRQTMLLAVSIAAFLAVIKGVASITTHSMGVLASAIDSFMDFLMSSLNLFAVLKAEKPPDKGHPYGHGKVEHIAGLFQCFFMGLSLLYLVGEALKRFLTGSYLKSYDVGFGVMFLSMGITVLLVLRLKWMTHRTRSIVLETEGLHYSTDILTNAGVIGALLLARMTGQVFWDLLISLVIAGYLIFQVSKIAKRAVNELMDHEPSQALQQEIKSFVLKHNVKIIDIHDFRSRSVGDQVFAEFHITIKDETSFRRAHDLTEGLVQALHKKFPKLEVNIHYDPHGTAEPHRPELEE